MDADQFSNVLRNGFLIASQHNQVLNAQLTQLLHSTWRFRTNLILKNHAAPILIIHADIDCSLRQRLLGRIRISKDQLADLDLSAVNDC